MSIPLCNDITYGPRAYFISEFIFNELYPEFAEVLTVGRSVEAKLHGNLYHHSTKHEGWVCGCATRGEWPRAKETKRFDNMITLRNVGQCTPYEAGDRACKRVQKSSISLVSPSANTDNGPEK